MFFLTTQVFNFTHSAFTTLSALALGCVLVGVDVKPAEAYTNCSGSEYYVTCTSSKYVNGQYVSCYGSGTPGYVYWTCNSF